MQEVDLVLKNLISAKSSAKRAGSRASNRFNFQASESLLLLLQQYENCEDFEAVFDYHEDFILFLKVNGNVIGKYYQIKTATAKWTVDSLIKKDKASGSIVYKMFTIATQFKANLLFFISNRTYLMKKNGDLKRTANSEVSLGQLHVDDKNILLTHITSEKVADYTDITTCQQSSLPINTAERETMLKGSLITFIEKIIPGAKYSPILAYLTLMREVTRRLEYEEEIKCIGDFRDSKSIEKSAFKEMIDSMVQKETLEKDLVRIEAQLQSEDIDYAEIRKIRAGIQKGKRLKIGKRNSYILLSSAVLDILNTNYPIESELCEQADSVVKLLQSNKNLTTPIKNLGLDNDELKAIVLYEIFKN
ncbi:MAG: hypothetical protein COW00_13605 [Bdellovibrio sp. CG12_big_fil_rev_8_21_14_0_65_39_13]|nr:MAG: hypothetical protein COW78_07030 [Bdellovibrio sp. CG22_combo_CG10-13_8_21_14_all_39_27]PIQ58652.1 MAG: hypothetical protein COW00_13605 [Bdellovibrio sp. CG12_big_fil_rev_8_21_14_0_65_39_13]PIR33027.1 MAG: hypothetical protein COV37_18200 [Bdellovibrio sp. CG11_big_fil_rev_8_21_14_0_20_39_38]